MYDRDFCNPTVRVDPSETVQELTELDPQSISFPGRIPLPITLDKGNADFGKEIVRCSEPTHKVTSEIYSKR